MTLLKFIAIACLSLTTLAHARLVWQTTVTQPEVGLTDKSVEAVFSFTNTGESAVEVTSVKSDCSCTVPELEKKVYEPGESGEIKATFTFGSRQGLQTKTIKVSTSDSREPTLLVIKAVIPETIEIKPKFVFWKSGEAPKPKIIRINVVQEDPIHVLSVKSYEPNMEAILKTIEDGRAYEVTILPLTTDKPFQAIITLKTDFPAEKPESYAIHALVK